MFSGSMVALVTPMHEDGSLDIARLHQLVDFHLAQQTDAIVAVGTTGESATLNIDEHCLVLEEVIRRTAGRIPVIAGTGANSTQEAIELTQHAKDLGAAAALLVTPYYNRPTQEGLYRHYRLLAEQVDIPQILYNVPSRTACDLLPDTVARLAQVPGIIGIKEATGDVNRLHQIKALVPSSFECYTGDDANTVAFILSGGCGVISVTANVAPKAMHEMCVAALQGDAATAEAINQQLMGLHAMLFIESNPIPVKWALSQMGLIEPGIRLPMTPLSPECYPSVRQALVQAGVDCPSN